MQSIEVLAGTSAAQRLINKIGKAATVDELAVLAGKVRPLVGAMIASGAGAFITTRAISILNDQITSRVIDLTVERFRIPPAEWAWIGFGSVGRFEQTLETDQDNGLIFSADDAAEAKELRTHFLPFARAVNENIAQCGFPLCAGEVMASNPKWCLSVDEWTSCFRRWVDTPEPEALLNASIFFDFRLTAGSPALVDQLRRHLNGLAMGKELFLRLMTENALASSPPLGRLKDFTTDDKRNIDLKRNGTRIFVDAVRILALANGRSEAGTVERLAALATLGVVPNDRIEGTLHAFAALQAIRLDAQIKSVDLQNRLEPDKLNSFDQRVLLESLKQARGLQQLLKLRFHRE
jgi:CBS domain-containing protein